MIGYVFRRRTKRGISTILGILFMVGILITSIIPLFMYVNEVNNYYDITVVDMKIADQDRSMEDLTVYAYGYNDTAIVVFLVNRSPLSVNITRIWVMRWNLNRTSIFNSTIDSRLPIHIRASGQVSIDLNIEDIIAIKDNLNSFNIEVATERGNKFSSQTNSLRRIVEGEEYRWETGAFKFQISVIVLSDQGNDRYFIEIEGIYNTTHYDFVDSSTVQGQFFSIFTLPMPGTYNVTVSNIKGPPYHVGNSTVALSGIHPTAVRQFDDMPG